MPKNSLEEDNSDDIFTKLLATVILIVVVVFSNVLITSTFPQNILISTDSVFNFNGNILTFEHINETGADIILNGESFRVENRDVIAMGGRNAITLSGCGCFEDCDIYYCGTLSIPTRLNQIILFEQSSTDLKDDLKHIEIVFKSQTITIENEINDIYLVSDGLNSYQVNLPVGATTYITDKNNEGLFKVKHEEGIMKISLVGYYPDEELKITATEEIIT